MTTVYRVRVNTDSGAFYYLGDAHVLQKDAYAAADAAHKGTTYEQRKSLGIVGITVEPLVIR